MNLRDRLRGILMLVSGTAIVFACGTFILVSVYTRRHGAVEDLKGLAGITARNCGAALDFGIREDAEKTLAALGIRPSIVLAQILDANGTLFAEYRAPGFMEKGLISIPEGELFAFGGGYLRVYTPILAEQRRLGTLLIKDNQSTLRKGVTRDFQILGGVMAVALVIALILSNRLAKYLSMPILALSDAARAVSARRDYSLRVPAARDDEIGVLARSFNDMLAAIHQRDAALQVEIEERRRVEREVRRHRDHLEEQVALRTVELKRSNTELEEFAYVASHDLQEPLRKVRSFTELFAQKFGSQVDEEGHRYIGYIVNGAERMQGLIQDLLTYSRVGRSELDLGMVDIGLLFDDVTLQIEDVVKGAQATITRDALPTLPVNARQIGMLFQNLLTNAIKFRRADSPRIHVAAQQQQDQMWLFSVSDNGIGIRPEHFERVFQIFQRLHARSEYPGTGIGLAICKRVVERHGGRIWLESVPDKGTTFFFTLPEQPAKTEEGAGA
jgi:signal transduction histidine kinase